MTQSTIHIIDDEPALLELLSEVVEQLGLEVQCYSRASSFFNQPALMADSILVLDLQMPEMDGIEVMRRLAAMDLPPALILVSGHDIRVLHAAEKLGRAQKLEILASLSKPLSLETLRQLLKQHAFKEGVEQSSDEGVIKQTLGADELKHAIEEGELLLHYQPQVNIATGKLMGVEALVRWQHPKQGLLYPDSFLPLAEESDLMDRLTSWVIGDVIQQKQQWNSLGLSLSVSVNISAVNITSLTLPEQVTDLLEDKQLDPTKLTLEVTETALMGTLVTSLDILTRLRLKGVKLSIDDFGTGYSSLSQLHRVPFSELKIDRSFVSGMSKDSEAHSIVKTCIILGHELNMHVIAEGVEDRETWALLRTLGCDVAQGYYIAKPMLGSALCEWVASS